MLRITQAAVITAIALTTSAVVAHSEIDDVQNEAVKARMIAMSTIGDASKVLGGMARGKTDFDQEAAQAAAKAIAETSAKIAALFEAEEGDPLSEALPAIWADFDDFAARANALEAAALKATGVASLDELRSLMGEIGKSCKGCHSDYREKKQ